MRQGLIILATMVLLPMASACSHSKPAESPCGGVEGGVTTGARTGYQGAKTGVETGIAGVKQFGSATAGVFTGGSDEAEKRWNKGKQETKAKAADGAERTSAEAHRCH